MIFSGLALLLAGQIAFAESSLRSRAVPSQEEATALSSEVLDVLVGETSLEVRILRFMVPKKGYEFRVSIVGFEDRTAATQTQLKLSDQNLVFILETDEPIDVIEPPVPLEPAETSPVASVEATENDEGEVNPRIFRKLKESRKLPTSDEILQQALKNYGPLGDAYRNAGQESLRYSRTFSGDNPRKIKHQFYRQDSAMHLKVVIAKGEGVSSTSILTADGEVYLQTNDGQSQRDGTRGKDVLQRFSAGHVLAIPLGFDLDVQSDGPWRELKSVRIVDDMWSMTRKKAGGSDGLLEANFSKDDWLLTRVIWLEGGEEHELQFSQFATLGELQSRYPKQVDLYVNGDLVEKIAISEFNITDAPDADLFIVSDN
ncbi:MAG: hypothetical protein ACON4U_16900 [Myxococcota bacterium]